MARRISLPRRQAAKVTTSFVAILIREQNMIAHASLSVRDFQKSKTLYLKALAPRGYRSTTWSTV